jgi:hypothetical protein
MKKTDGHFSIHDFYWRDQSKKAVIEAVVVLNSLNEEQISAVKLLKESAYREGDSDGYEQAASEYQD